MRSLLLLLAVFLAPSAGAQGVRPDPPDACLESEAGASCKPLIGAAGTCRWLTRDERNAMELPGQARCETKDGACARRLMCVNDDFAGDVPAMLARAEEHIAAKRIWEADALLRYLKWSERALCDREMAARWHRLGKAAEGAGVTPSGFYYEAMACDPGLDVAYLDVAAYWSSQPPSEHTIGMAAAGLISLSRAMLNRDASAADWKAQVKRIEADPRLEALRRSARYADVKRRFTVGAENAARNLPYAYCELAPEAARAWNIAAETTRCGFPDGLTFTVCPEHYDKHRAAAKPAGLPTCKR